MKKLLFIVLSCVMFFGVSREAHAQIDLLAAPILATLNGSKVENALYYLESVAQMVTNATNTYNQFQNMLRQEKMALDNLSKIGDVRDRDSFTNWFNRQLYLERQAESKFNSMNIKIGSTDYALKDIKDIPNAIREGYFDAEYWNNSLSENERKALWNKMGLTPANYAYLKVWEAREEKLGQEIVTKLEIMNEENAARAERRAALAQKIADDASLPEDEKMGDKELQIAQLEAQTETNEHLQDVAHELAVQNEADYIRDRKADMPDNPPLLSNNWGYDPYADFTITN